jgi:sulfide dehydrogenase [flavocytochrome c] flavoprotein subunit
MKFNRRDFLRAFGTAVALTVTPTVIKAKTAPKIIVVGGGFAGSTVARYLAMWSQQSIDVTLIDPAKGHVSCVMSNLVLNRQLNLNQLTFSHDALEGLGISVIRDKVASIGSAGKSVTLVSGATLACDRLVLAPGIDFKVLDGTDFNLTPHAWIAGSQTRLFASQVNRIRAGSTYIMTIPKAPYRCPPGPYERACVVADIIMRKGFNGGDTKVIVLDENDGIQAEKDTFERAYSSLYQNIVEYIPNATIETVDSVQKTISTSRGDFSADVMNIIPRHQAAEFVRNAGLTDGGDWALVDPLTYESTLAEYSGVHVIGDTQNTSQPKSAHMANAQAKICADAIIRSLNGQSNFEQERIDNITTNSACYSPITFDQASWLTANYAYDPNSNQMSATHVGEAEEWSKDNYEQMFDWAKNLFNDSFGETLRT